MDKYEKAQSRLLGKTFGHSKLHTVKGILLNTVSQILSVNWWTGGGSAKKNPQGIFGPKTLF